MNPQNPGIDNGRPVKIVLGELRVTNKIKRTRPTNPRISKDRDPRIDVTRNLRAPTSILGRAVPVSMLGRPFYILDHFAY